MCGAAAHRVRPATCMTPPPLFIPASRTAYSRSRPKPRAPWLRLRGGRRGRATPVSGPRTPRRVARNPTSRGFARRGRERAAQPRLSRSSTSGQPRRESRADGCPSGLQLHVSERRASRTAVRRSSTFVAHTGALVKGRSRCSFSMSRTMLIRRGGTHRTDRSLPAPSRYGRIGQRRGSHRASFASFRTGAGAAVSHQRSTATTSAPPSKRLTSSGRCSG